MSENRSEAPPRSLAAAFLAFGLSLALLAPPPLYLWKQGVFDTPRVRLTRLLTGNDPALIAVARATEATPPAQGGRTAAWVEALSGAAPGTVVRLDWSDDAATAEAGFDLLLRAHGIAERPDPALLADHLRGFDAPPVAVTLLHYLRILTAHDLTLMTIDLGCPCYTLLALPRRAARGWWGAGLGDEGARYAPAYSDRPLMLLSFPEIPPEADLATDTARLLAGLSPSGPPAPKRPPIFARVPLDDLF